MEDDVSYRYFRDLCNNLHECVVVPSDYAPTSIALALQVSSTGHEGDKALLVSCKKFAYWSGMKKTN